MQCYRMPQNAFFFFYELEIFWPAKKRRKDTFFPTLHPLFPVIFATASVVAFVLLCNSRFNFHCYTQRETMPAQKSAWKWHYDFSRLLAWKITKGIHSCKPASLNHPVGWTEQALCHQAGSLQWHTSDDYYGCVCVWFQCKSGILSVQDGQSKVDTFKPVLYNASLSMIMGVFVCGFSVRAAS